MQARQSDPTLYRRLAYEVVGVLDAPSSYPRVLSDTHAQTVNYAFASDQQKKQIRSSVLLSVDLETPCAFVIASNEFGAFSETDPDVIAFVRAIASLVRFDLFSGDLVNQRRTVRPDLFSPDSS